jgi:hypothetical protein
VLEVPLKKRLFRMYQEQPFHFPGTARNAMTVERHPDVII